MANQSLEPRKSQGLFQGFDHLFDDDFFAPVSWPSISRSAQSHIRESELGYVISTDIPGIPKDQVNVSVQGNRLTIRAEHQKESGKAESESGYSHHHRSFIQSFTLPSNANGEQIEAHCDNGHLDVWIPKTDAVEGRKIEVQSGQKSFLDRFSSPTSKVKTEQKMEDKKH